MKRFAFVALCLLFVLSACGAPTTEKSLSELAEALAASQPEPEVYFNQLTPQDALYELKLQNSYHLDIDYVEDGIILYGSGMEAYEIALFLLPASADQQQAVEALQGYISDRTADFYGYAPEQTALLEQAAVESAGRYVALLICADTDAAQAAFADCFDYTAGTILPAEPSAELDENGYVVYRQPGEADMTVYDTGGIVSAYRSGEDAALSEQDKEILRVCEEAISAVIREDMTDYEKELAIHDWIIQWADYDRGAFADKAGENASNPYGILVDRKGICLGYATTFDLFMQLLDIQTQLVVGASFHSSEDHAWNMVLLDGAWYCVDVTWDDQITWDQLSEQDAASEWQAMDHALHQYFNVTSEFMRLSDHQWDYDAVPEATETKYAYPHS